MALIRIDAWQHLTPRSAVVGGVADKRSRLRVPRLMPAQAASLLLTRLMAGLLYGVSAMDPLTFAVVAMLLMVASFVEPMRRIRTPGALACTR
jgi:hypothetical protein